MPNILKHKLLIMLIGVFILVAAGSSAYYFLYINKSDTTSSNTSTIHHKKTTPKTAQNTTTNPTKVDPTKEALINKDAGVTWVAATKITNPNIFSKPTADTNCDLNQSTDFYNIGTDTDGAQIDYINVTCSMAPVWIIMRQKDGKYEFVSRQNTDYIDAGISTDDILANSNVISNDSKTFYETLSFPKNITSAVNHQFSIGDQVLTPDNLTGPTFFEQTPSGPIYKYLKSGEGDSSIFSQRAFYLKTPSSLYVNYPIVDPMIKNTDEGILYDVQITGGKASDTYSNQSAGCGSIYGTIAILSQSSGIESRIIKVGTSSTGTTIYGFNSVSDPIIKSIYKEYSTVNEGGPIATINQFYQNKGAVLYKDQLNDYVILDNNSYALTGGCGKPVIYLYPTKTTSVSVKVGAKIVKSDPLYNDGWNNVIAEPSGKLNYQGKIYNSLFWEGYGQEYPKADIGFMVKQADLAQTISSHLVKLGLNSKEKSDFLSFWLPKLPKTPYVRLSWLMTPEMNKLAPLTVTPKPDTLIRIFLDYQPLQKPYPIKLQQLYAPKRQGFTLVEWGGLLLHGIK